MPMIPKTLGACADKLYQLKEARLKIQAQADKIEEQEKAIKEYVIQNLGKENAEGVAGHVAKVSITRSVVPTAKDWDKFYAHVLKTKDFSLMQKRLHEAACRERWDDGKEIPGVESFQVVKVSLTKV